MKVENKFPRFFAEMDDQKIQIETNEISIHLDSLRRIILLPARTPL